MKKGWIAAMALSSVVPAAAGAQHGGHGGQGATFNGGHQEEAPPRPPPRREPMAPPKDPPRGPTQIYVLVDEKGFSPTEIPLKAGEPAEIIVMRRTEATCAKEIVVADLDVRLPLPLDQPVKFALKPTVAGRIHFTCGEGHVGGDIVVR